MRPWSDPDRGRDTRHVGKWFRGSEEFDPRNLNRWSPTPDSYQQERNRSTDGAFSHFFVRMFMVAAIVGLVIGTIVALAGWWNAHV